MTEEREPPEPHASTSRARFDASFFRKRLARGLVALGIALVAVRFLPHLPEDHSVLFHAPSGNELVELEISYYDDDGELLVGAELHPGMPAETIAHTVRVPAGEVRLELIATLMAKNGRRQQLLEQRRLLMDGGAKKVYLRAPGGSANSFNE